MHDSLPSSALPLSLSLLAGQRSPCRQGLSAASAFLLRSEAQAYLSRAVRDGGHCLSDSLGEASLHAAFELPN